VGELQFDFRVSQKTHHLSFYLLFNVFEEWLGFYMDAHACFYQKKM
jgi:hypothetical protein